MHVYDIYEVNSCAVCVLVNYVSYQNFKAGESHNLPNFLANVGHE